MKKRFYVILSLCQLLFVLAACSNKQPNVISNSSNETNGANITLLEESKNLSEPSISLTELFVMVDGRLEGECGGVIVDAVILDNSQSEEIPYYFCSKRVEINIGHAFLPQDWQYLYTDDSGCDFYVNGMNDEYYVSDGAWWNCYLKDKICPPELFFANSDEQSQYSYQIVNSIHYAIGIVPYCSKELEEIGIDTYNSVLQYDISYDDESCPYTSMEIFRQTIDKLPIFDPSHGRIMKLWWNEDISGLALAESAVFYSNDSYSICRSASGYMATEYKVIETDTILYPEEWLGLVIPDIKEIASHMNMSELEVYSIELGYLNIVDTNIFNSFGENDYFSDESYIVPVWCVRVIEETGSGEFIYSFDFFVNAYNGELMYHD